MRIIYFSNEDVPGDHAGAVHSWAVARGLVCRGHEVTLVSAARPGLAARERREGVLILRAPSRLAGVKCNLRAFHLLPYLLSQPYDVVMERYLTLNGLGFIFATLKNLPYFVEVNGPHLEEIGYRLKLAGTRRMKILTWWVDLQFRRADGACAPNPAIVRPPARPRAHKIIWGVDEDKFTSTLRNSPRSRRWRENLGGRFAVVFVGSFHPWQGARDLPAIVAAATNLVPGVKFWLVGDGPDRPAAEEELLRRGLTASVAFTGWVPHGELPFLLAAADAAVAPFNDDYYPPLKEFGFFWAPTKVLECLASGLPVVTSDYPVLNEMVTHGRSGLLAAPGKAEKFALSIATLAQDAERRREMSTFAEKDVKERFGWRRHCEILEDLLRRAIAERRRRAP